MGLLSATGSSVVNWIRISLCFTMRMRSTKWSWSLIGTKNPESSGMYICCFVATVSTTSVSPSLDAPLHGCDLRIVGVRYEHLNPAVGIGPLELLHRADECNLLSRIEHGAGVVSKCRARHQHCADEDQGVERSVHIGGDARKIIFVRPAA